MSSSFAEFSEAGPECSNRLRTSAAVAVDDHQPGNGSILYQTVYTETGWAGDLISTCIDGRGDAIPCQCKDDSGMLEECTQPFSPGFPEIKWSADTVAWQVDVELNKDLEDGWWRQRRVITYSDQAKQGVSFDYGSISDDQRKWLRYDPDLLAFIRGDRSMEGVRFRKRYSYYGDFINATPVIYSSILIAGANDGMLHVFDEPSGQELFSYVPGLLFAQWLGDTSGQGSHSEKLAVLGDIDYQDNHQSYVDGQVAVQYLEDDATTLAVGALGPGGAGIFALNLLGIREMHDIEAQAADIVMWEFPDPTRDGLQEMGGRLVPVDPEVDESGDVYSDAITALSIDPWLGKLYGTPKIVRLPFPEGEGYRWCVVFGNGYQSRNQVPVLYILDAYDGSVIKRIITTKQEEADQSGASGCNEEFGCNGLSSPVLVDDDEDGVIDYGYGGDLAGNLWKFDFTMGGIYGADGYAAAFHDDADPGIDGRPAPRPLITVTDQLGNLQPITTEPTVTRPCNAAGEGMMVLFGTGWLDPAAEGGSSVQSVYGIWDWQNFWRVHPDLGIDPAMAHYGELGAIEGSGIRHLADLSRLFGAAEVERIGLLEQTQHSFVGLNYFSAMDATVLSGTAAAGELKSIDELPGDFSGYDQVVRTLSKNPINWFSPEILVDGAVTDGTDLHLGWFFDLPFADEQFASDPVVHDGVLYYSTSLWTESECGIDGSNTMIMAHDSCSGGAAETIVFDLNGDKMMSSNDAVALYDVDGSDPDGSDDASSPVPKASGVLATNTVAAPSFIGGQPHDLMFVAEYVSGDAGMSVDHTIEPGKRPEVAATAVRGRNLGTSFWREIY